MGNNTSTTEEVRKEVQHDGMSMEIRICSRDEDMSAKETFVTKPGAVDDLRQYQVNKAVEELTPQMVWGPPLMMPTDMRRKGARTFIKDGVSTGPPTYPSITPESAHAFGF